MICTDFFGFQLGICRASSHRSPALDKFHPARAGGANEDKFKSSKCINVDFPWADLFLGSARVYGIDKSQRSWNVPKSFDSDELSVRLGLSTEPLSVIGLGRRRFLRGPEFFVPCCAFHSLQSNWALPLKPLHSSTSDVLHVSIGRSPFSSGKPTILLIPRRTPMSMFPEYTPWLSLAWGRFPMHMSGRVQVQS
jgi:hypothetical protein